MHPYRITHTHTLIIHIYNVTVFSGIRAYEQLGNRAFGPAGKMLAACIITVHNIGGTVRSFLYHSVNACLLITCRSDTVVLVFL